MAHDGTTTIGDGDTNAAENEVISGKWTFGEDLDFDPDNNHVIRSTDQTWGIYDTVQQTFVLWFDRRAITNNIGGPEYNGAVRFANCMLWENNNGELVVRDSGGIDTVIS